MTRRGKRALCPTHPKTMRIYIAGPMRGFSNHNFEAFDAARDALHAQGHDPVSPADLDRAVGFDPSGEPSPEFLREALDRDIEALKTCDAVYLLKGWRDSVGATAEWALARWLGLEIIEQPESVLEEAQRITGGARRRDYDSATPNHARIAGAWNWYLGARKTPGPITPLDASLMMGLLKIARACHTPTRDSFVDLAGYARCSAQIAGFEQE